jgi:pantoate--beta-alanine ligase
MIIFKKAGQLSEYISLQKAAGKKAGFVPTMGALHKGHLSLIEAAKQANDLVICSIFVNPTQFNNPDDFKHYPITIEKDIELLVSSGCDVLFLPSVEEIYPTDYITKHYELGSIENTLEGSYRPGHFQGVCQVVDRLLHIVNPHNLYLGQKDLQQCQVISKLIKLLGKVDSIKLNIVSTIRESDGLAMSSRNLRLNDQERRMAVVLYKELQWIKDHLKSYPPDTLTQYASDHLKKAGFVVDYIAIANRTNLQPASDLSQPLAVLVAATIGKIRLIDNLFLN